MNAPASSRKVEEGRPSIAALVLAQLRHANRGFWRTPIAAFFTLVFPLLFLLLLGALTGNQTIDARRGIRVAQFLTPAIGAFAAAVSCYTSLAIGVAIAREEGVLKRLRGTPLPAAVYLLGRVGSATWIALLAMVVMVVAGVAFFDVQVIAAKLPAAVVTALVGIVSFSALGLAVVALAPSGPATQAITNATLIPVAFISDVFVVGAELPRWLEVTGWVLPLKHFANALGGTFDPFLAGAGFAWDHLAVMAAWGLGALAVAAWRFSWEPHRSRSSGRSASRHRPDSPREVDPALVRTPPRPVAQVGRPRIARLVWGQTRYGTMAFLRDRPSAFFTLAFPVLLLVLFFFVFGNPVLEAQGGIRLVQYSAPALAVYGMGVAAYQDFAERMAAARDLGILKRVRGTPLPAWAFVAGRVGSAVILALGALVLTVGVGAVFFGVRVVPRMLGGVVVSVTLGIACFTVLGLALASAVPNARAVPAVANATLLPLAFVSDIFLIGELPRWMEILGDVFPLKHIARAVADGFNPTVSGFGFFPGHLAVIVVWLVVGLAAILRWFSWQPR